MQAASVFLGFITSQQHFVYLEQSNFIYLFILFIYLFLSLNLRGFLGFFNKIFLA